MYMYKITDSIHKDILSNINALCKKRAQQLVSREITAKVFKHISLLCTWKVFEVEGEKNKSMILHAVISQWHARQKLAGCQGGCTIS